MSAPDFKRFARVDRRGMSIVTATEAEGVQGFRASLDLFKRGWTSGYVSALLATSPACSSEERLAKWREWFAEDAEKAFAREFPEGK